MTDDPIDWQAHRAETHHLGRLQEFLKQIVYGGNDGIVTTFAIVAGFAGASAEGAEQVGALAVLVFGLANLFADATSMGLGEFLSTRSQRDLYLSQRATELRELRESPAQERAEVVQMLTERGLNRDDAGIAADHLMKSPELVVDMMMSYELQMPDMRTATPVADGLFTFGAFIVFGGIPLAPFFLRPGADPAAIWLSVAATFAALIALGLLRWRATEERLTRCVAETVAVGGTCAAVAFAVGALVGGLGS
jgi:VIT1/CCC1 family predicted Fe2+/Mn2+ transporter